MRYILTAVILSILTLTTSAGTPSAQSQTCRDGLGLSFGVATLCLPSELYRNAVIAPTGGLVVKFTDGSYLYVRAIAREEEGLPQAFDMRTYPEYLMGAGEAEKLPPEELKKFSNSKSVLLERYGKQGIRTEKFSGYKALIAEKEQAGEAYLTFDDHSDALLLFGYAGLSKTRLHLITHGFM